MNHRLWLIQLGRRESIKWQSSRGRNSSVVLWAQRLHHNGLRIDSCNLLLNAEFHEEDAVLVEHEEHAAELKECAPPASPTIRAFS